MLHQIVNNQRVIHDLEVRGVLFTEQMESIPAGAVTVLSTHGVADAVMQAAYRQGGCDPGGRRAQ